MELKESIVMLADRSKKIRDSLSTEEATKNALVMPFIRALGYDVFNPLEVVPEFIADIAGRKGEKIDYAILQDDTPIILIECKTFGTNLNDANRDQLHRYFLTLNSVIGVLTDGVTYQFFSTSDDGKNMDSVPFMELNLDNIDMTLIPELMKLCKGKFDLQNTLDTVSELKFNRQVKMALKNNLENPDISFTEYFLSSAGIKNLYRKTKEEKYSPYVKRAFNEFITEQVDIRLKTALASASKKEETESKKTPVTPLVEKDIITEEEYQAFYLVKSILIGTVDSERIFLRNLSGTGRSSIILDDTQRKPLLYLNFTSQDNLYVETVSSVGREWHQISKVDDIFGLSNEVKKAVQWHLSGERWKNNE